MLSIKIICSPSKSRETIPLSRIVYTVCALCSIYLIVDRPNKAAPFSARQYILPNTISTFCVSKNLILGFLFLAAQTTVPMSQETYCTIVKYNSFFISAEFKRTGPGVNLTMCNTAGSLSSQISIYLSIYLSIYIYLHVRLLDLLVQQQN